MPLAFWSLALLALIAARIALRNRRLDMTWLLILWAPFNRLTFNFRSLAYREPRPVELKTEPKTDLFSHATASRKRELEDEELRLRTTYDLEDLRGRSTRWNYRENLYVLRLLEVAFATVELPVMLPSPRRVLDVGSATFCYATALERFCRLRLFSAPVQVTGLEIDGNVVYRDRTTRADHARAAAQLASTDTKFEVGNFVERREHDLSLVTMFYPFVTRGALLRWGLPRGLFQKDALLSHAVNVIAPAGFLLVVNHTHEERDVVRAFMASREDVESVGEGAVASDLVDYAPDVVERSYSLYRKQRLQGD